jgi:hypothetical protein
VTLPRLQPWATSRQAVSQLLHGATLRLCAPVALLVGTLLSLVNQADIVLAGDADGRVVAKVAANLLIPFLTSSTGALLAVRAPRHAAAVGAHSS